MSRTNIRIGLLHHVGGGNLGDDATLESVAGNIRQRWPRAEIIAFSMNAGDTAARHGMTAYPVRRTSWSPRPSDAGAEPDEESFRTSLKKLTRNYAPLFHLLKATSAVVRLTTEPFRELSFLIGSHRQLKSLDLLIVSGGGQLTERDGSWGFPYTIFKWLWLARWAGVRCMFLNVGAGPLTLPLSKFFVKRALAGAEYISLRDQESQDLLSKIGFKGESQVYLDSAYGLPFTYSAKAAAAERSIVGFAPMPYPDQRAHASEADQIVYDAFIGKLAAFASRLLDRSYTLRVFGTDTGADPAAIKDFEAALLKQREMVPQQYSVSDSIVSVQDLLTTIAGADFVVTCRFHGVIFAHLLNKPVLAIAHHPKVTDLMASLDLSDYCVDIRDFDPNLLEDRFASMIANADEIKQRMVASLTKNRQRLTTQFDGLFNADAVATLAAEPSWDGRRRDQTGGLSCG